MPVTGAGYRGPFTGTGFDSMWTDMSEIVRPTRDGIHGREYISTSVELGRKLNHLEFGENGRLLSTIPKTIDIPLPVIFDLPEAGLSPNVKAAMVKAAVELGTCIVMPAAEIAADFEQYLDHIIPCIAPVGDRKATDRDSRKRAWWRSTIQVNRPQNFPTLKARIEKDLQCADHHPVARRLREWSKSFRNWLTAGRRSSMLSPTIAAGRSAAHRLHLPD